MLSDNRHYLYFNYHDFKETVLKSSFYDETVQQRLTEIKEWIQRWGPRNPDEITGHWTFCRSNPLSLLLQDLFHLLTMSIYTSLLLTTLHFYLVRSLVFFMDQSSANVPYFPVPSHQVRRNWAVWSDCSNR